MAISKLESKKILMDFKHAKEELNLKKEMISEIDPMFNQAIQEFLKTNQILKDRWDNMFDSPSPTSDSTTIEKFNKPDVEEMGEMEDMDSEKENSEAENVDEPEKEIKEEVEDAFASVYKMVYREIVKKSHPDKTSHLSDEEREYRNDIYLDATKAYEAKNIGELLYCAHLLRIDFGISKEAIFFLKDTVDKYKKEASFLEQTYSWKWFYSDDLTKRMLVEKFVNQLIDEN
jgi:hypothetical protein